MAENNVLKLYKGQAHKIRVEKAEEFEKSYFLDAYKQAFGCFWDIHQDNERFQETAEYRAAKREFNNVITFCGERGSGKTSAMISFQNALANWKSDHSKIKDLLPTDLKAETQLNFVCLDAIDPSRFESNDRLSGTVLSELYRRYQEQAQKGDHKNYEAQRKLEKSFSDFLKGIQLLSNSKPFGEQGRGESDFEVLAGIAGAAGLRKTFHELVENYLRYEVDGVFGSDLKNTYLVIPVDDLDLSVEHAFNLAEDIRKYMQVPNVIILIAMKLDQLRLAVEQANYHRFKDIREASKRPDERYIEDMSNMYLEKLIPVSRRIVLPLIGKIINGKSQLVYYGKRMESTEAELPILEAESLVLKMIQEKTLLIFRPKNGIAHPLVPKTIRELQNFLEFLDGIPAPSYDKNFRNIFAPGLTRFQEYFYEFWIPNSLKRDEEEFFTRLKSTDFPNKNAVSVYYLGEIIQNLKAKYNTLLGQSNPPDEDNLLSSVEYFDDLPRIVSVETFGFNISLGDVLLYTSELERLDRGRSFERLIFAIKTYYSQEIARLLVDRSCAPLKIGGRNDLGDLLGGAYLHPTQIQFVPKPARAWEFDNRHAYTPKTADVYQLFSLWNPKGKSLIFKNDQFKISLPWRQGNEQTSFLKSLTKKLALESEADQSHPSIFSSAQKIAPLIAFSSFLYFGSDSIKPNYRNSTFRWYLQTSNLLSALSVPSNLLFDFKAIFFWSLVPEINVFRMYGTSRDKYLEELENEPFKDQSINDQDFHVEEDLLANAQTELLRNYSSKVNWLSLISLAQIDPMIAFSEEVSIIIARAKKNTSYVEEKSFASDLSMFLDALKEAFGKFSFSFENSNSGKDNVSADSENLDFSIGGVFPLIFGSEEKLKKLAGIVSDEYFWKPKDSEAPAIAQLVAPRDIQKIYDDALSQSKKPVPGIKKIRQIRDEIKQLGLDYRDTLPNDPNPDGKMTPAQQKVWYQTLIDSLKEKLTETDTPESEE